jgi:hypothetical protein
MIGEELLNDLAELLKDEMKQQLKIADHIMTGSLSESIEERILTTIDGRKIEIWINDYGIALDQGVPADRIPFTEPSGRGGRSKYIEGLQRFAQLKLGVTDKRKSLGISFEIARKNMYVSPGGMPVKGPSQFIKKTLTENERFLITSDRDEKIRISHFPNSYNIEAYLLKHKEFVGNIAYLSYLQVICCVLIFPKVQN